MGPKKAKQETDGPKGRLQRRLQPAPAAQGFDSRRIPTPLLRLQREQGNRVVMRRLQAKLKRRQSGDPQEKEAEQVADRATMTSPVGPDYGAQRALTPDIEVDKLARGASLPTLTQLPSHIADEGKSGFTNDPEDAMNGVLPHAGEKVTAASNSTGQPLPPQLQRRFDRLLGTDLGAVRIHTGPESIAASEAIRERAYTMGRDIHFNAGEYHPESPEGQGLLAHEVVHTVQEAGLPTQGVERSRKPKGYEGDPNLSVRRSIANSRGGLGGDLRSQIREVLLQRQVICPPGFSEEEGTGSYEALDNVPMQSTPVGVCSAPSEPNYTSSPANFIASGALTTVVKTARENSASRRSHRKEGK